MICKLLNFPFRLLSRFLTFIIGITKGSLSLFLGLVSFIINHLTGSLLGALIGVLLGRKHVGIKHTPKKKS